ncbi:hypothetical protein BGZ81_003090 [Podila clonocystis]|nr:hypothetical protein BGZ81_003090 [Podila clonocystis]
MVGLTNADVTRYTTSIRLQPARTDVIADFADMKPERILVYRDGLSEGEFPNLMKAGIDALCTCY